MTRTLRGSGAKRLVASALSRSPLQTFALQSSRDHLCVLAYHGVSDGGRFAAQLDWLVDHNTPVSLDDVSGAVLEGRQLPDRPVLLTFDDGERSLLEVGAPLLRERGLPAVAFVVAGLIDTDHPFWWVEADELARAGGTAENPGQLVRRLKRLQDVERRHTLERMRARADRVVRTPQLTAEDLRKLELDGIAVANHSLTHPCLDRCDDDVLLAEVGQAHSLLTDMLGHQPEAFAYPNGNWDARVRSEVAAAGYRVAFAFDHRLAMLPVQDRLTVSRVRVDAAADLDRFRILVSGLHSRIHHARGLS